MCNRVAVELLRNGHIDSILEEGSTKLSDSLTGDERRVMVGSWLRTLNIPIAEPRSKVVGQGRQAEKAARLLCKCII